MSTNFTNGVSSFGVPVLSSVPMVSPFSKVIFVDGNVGSDGYNGSTPALALRTMSKAFTSYLASGDTIVFRGNIREELTTPAGVFDVTIVGAGNKPRHADAHTGNGGFSAATWKPPAVPTAATPLLIVQQQGWSLYNILFDCPVDAAAVQLLRNAGADDAERDASHATISGCRFATGQNAIELKGGPDFVRIENNTLHGLTTSAIKNTVGAGVGTNFVTEILNNRFTDNVSHIVCPLNESHVIGNSFGKFTAGTGFGLDLSGGAGGSNQVHGNYFTGDYDGDYVAATGDDWAGNYSMDVASAEVGAEGLTIAVPVA